MSINSRQLTFQPIEGTHIYEIRDIPSYESESPPELVLDVREDDYNLEWKTDQTLEDFINVLSDLPVIDADSEAEAWMSTERPGIDKRVGTYEYFTENPELWEDVVNFQLEADSGRLFWEYLEEVNIIEVTSAQPGTDVFEYLYSETTSKPPEMIAEEISEILTDKE